MRCASATIFVSCAFIAFFVAVSNAAEVASGRLHKCALYEHSVKCWGYNGNGQLGIGSTTVQHSPAEAVDLGDDFRPSKLYSGSNHVCAVTTEGDSKCWGENNYGQLGTGSTDRRGDGPNEMGDSLLTIDWGTDFQVESMCCGLSHSCALSTNAKLKCIGRNQYGQLGIGNTGDLHSARDTEIDLGFEVAQIGCNSYSTFALSTGGVLKGWGYNSLGQLLQGNTLSLGDETGEMGDSLPVMDLGNGFEIKAMSMGHDHSCAVSTDGQLKCWGWNNKGQLGYEDQNNRGDGPGETGQNLPTVNLGSTFLVSDVAAGYQMTCATSTSGAMKCWGYNDYGQLGQGSTSWIGDDSNEMGDFLAETIIGSEFTASVRLPSRYGLYFGVAFEESTSELLLKCWGYNQYGQCGYGDTVRRGDQNNEMGDYLGFVNLNFTRFPTTDPTAAPTSEPSVEPTMPSASCPEANRTSVNWDELLNVDDTGYDLLHSSSVEFAASSLSLTLSVELEFVGLSADGNYDDEYNLGTSYWIDFQSFGESVDSIDDAGTCGNRQSDDYEGLDFSEYWGYTTDPEALEVSSTAERMAYPPSGWTLSSADCNTVRYERTFSWTELTACDASEDGDDPLVTVTETPSAILLRGTFFVELVSPYSMSSDDYYRSYPLVQQDFAVALSRSVNVLASTGVQLFITSVLAFGRDDDGNYEMTILVQSADFVQLGTDNAVAVISGPDWLTVDDVETVTGSECLVASSFTCGQIYTVTISTQCSSDDSAVDLGGEWQFAFNPQCRDSSDGDTAACDTFLGTLGTPSKVVLDVTSSFEDDCAVNLFNVTFEGALTFYSDSDFTQTASESFVIGQDTIYGEIVVDYLADEDGADYEFLNVSIETVWVCTAADDDTAALAATTNSDDVPGVGGCLSPLIDDDGPYTVIGDNAGPYEGSTAYADPRFDAARFSFLTFDTPKTTIAVHVQLLLTLLTETGTERRRMLLEVSSANQLKHFVGIVSVEEAEEGEFGTAAEQSSALDPVVVVAIGGAVGVAVLVVAVVLLLALRSKTRERAHRRCDDRLDTKPEANLAQHIAVQSSTAKCRRHIAVQFATTDLGKQTEAQTVGV